MASPSPREDLAIPPRLSKIEESVARSLIAAHRARLDWLLRVPEWAAVFADGVAQLELPGQRQGIAFDAALLSLALEHKYQLIRWSVGQFRGHLRSSVGQRICDAWGLEGFNNVELESLLSGGQWMRLREALGFRIGQEHRRYKHAQQLLFTGYHHLVDQVVNQVVFHAAHRADCAQEGALGLLHAIDRADASGQNFAAYANAWIRRFVRNYLMRQRLPVYAPVNLVSEVAALARETEEPAPPADAACTRVQALLLECLRHPAVSLDEPVGERGAPVAEAIADPASESPVEAAMRSDAQALVGQMLESLTKKQREVLVHRFGLGDGVARTLAQIARLTGISHQQVSMRERRALQRLATALHPMAAELSAW